MGYMFYEISRPNGRPMKRGYGVGCKCHARGCKERIDRGMAYLCYDCTWYFCEDHLTMAFCPHDEVIELECFAGAESQVCQRCRKRLEDYAEKHPEYCDHEDSLNNNPTLPEEPFTAKKGKHV